MGNPDELRVRHIRDLLLGQWVVERPTAEIASSNEPGIRCQYRPAILEDLDGGVSYRLKTFDQPNTLHALQMLNVTCYQMIIYHLQGNMFHARAKADIQ